MGDDGATEQQHKDLLFGWISVGWVIAVAKHRADKNYPNRVVLTPFHKICLNFMIGLTKIENLIESQHFALLARRLVKVQAQMETLYPLTRYRLSQRR